MDWNRVKSIFIYILIAINIGLFALNYKEGQKYTLTSEQERAVYELLSNNNIGIYTDLIKKFNPMRQLAVTTPVFDNDSIRGTFFDQDEEIRITVDFDQTVFKSESKTVTLYGNILVFDCPNGTGKLENFTKKEAAEYAESFNDNLTFDSKNNIKLEKVSEYEKGYMVYFNELYGKNSVFCSSREVYVTENGIISMRAEFYNIEGYIGEKRQICSCDEALLTVLYAIKNSNNEMPTGAYIEKIELGYDLQVQSDISQVNTLKLVPCYRVFISGFEKPFIIDAYTNTLTEIKDSTFIQDEE